MQRQKHAMLQWDPQNASGRRRDPESRSDERASMGLDFTRYASRREVSNDSQHINSDPIEFYLPLFYKEFIAFISVLNLLVIHNLKVSPRRNIF